MLTANDIFTHIFDSSRGSLFDF